MFQPAPEDVYLGSDKKGAEFVFREIRVSPHDSMG